MLVGIIAIILWIATIVGYVIYNLYTKNVKLEGMLEDRDTLLKSLSYRIDESDRLLKEVDKLGAFQSDDEIGFFFKIVKSIQDDLNQYKVK